jgi:hypothetical protein
MEERAIGGSPADREEVCPNRRVAIAYNDCGVSARGTVEQGARAGDNGSVPRDANIVRVAMHSFAGVRFVEFHVAGGWATTLSRHFEVAVMPIITSLVTFTFGIASPTARAGFVNWDEARALGGGLDLPC